MYGWRVSADVTLLIAFSLGDVQLFGFVLSQFIHVTT